MPCGILKINERHYKLCNLVIKREKHREEIYLGKTKKDRVELTTVANSMMAGIVLLVNSQKLISQTP